MEKIIQVAPKPVMIGRLKTLRGAGVSVGSILDVGVQAGTDFLVECFPDVPHILFDAIDDYFATVQQRYVNLNYDLIHLALSDTDGSAWQIGESRDGTKRITHSYISDIPVIPGSKISVLQCKPIRKARIDTFLIDKNKETPYLLKLDVDGHEIPILHGAVNTLKNTSIIIVEAAIATIREKINLLENSGFQLMDIVDPCYYYDMLSQVDLIFVNTEWINKCDDLRPWQTKNFAWSAWSKFV